MLLFFVFLFLSFFIEAEISFADVLLPNVVMGLSNIYVSLFWIMLILLTVFLFIAIYSLSVNKHSYSILEDDFNYVQESGRISHSERQMQQLVEDEKTASQSFAPLQLDQPSLYQRSGETEFIQKAKEIVLSQIQDPSFGVQELAGALHLSQSQLNRKLNAHIGCPSSIFIRSLRLKKAAEMLAISEKNVQEVAYSVGFKDSGYFSRAFKNKFDESPTMYRSSRS